MILRRFAAFAILDAVFQYMHVLHFVFPQYFAINLFSLSSSTCFTNSNFFSISNATCVDTIVSTIKRTDKTPLKTNKIFHQLIIAY